MGLWNVATRRGARIRSPASNIAFSPDGYVLIDEYIDSLSLSMYDPETVEEIPLATWWESVGHHITVSSGGLLASANRVSNFEYILYEYAVSIWDMATG